MSSVSAEVQGHCQQRQRNDVDQESKMTLRVEARGGSLGRAAGSLTRSPSRFDAFGYRLQPQAVRESSQPLSQSCGVRVAQRQAGRECPFPFQATDGKVAQMTDRG
jgi:hypothetical protein